MKLLAPLAVFVAFCCFIHSAVGGDKKKDEPIDKDAIKFELGHLEKTWGIKFKSAVKTMAAVPRGKSDVAFVPAMKITLEFSKDVEDVKEMQKAFMPYYYPGN